MSGNRRFKLSFASLVVVALLLGAVGSAFAAPAAPASVSSSAPCYGVMREDLGTVLPSGWAGYRQQAACDQAAQEYASIKAQAVPVVLPAAGASAANAAACFASLRDLGTVLPGRFAQAGC